LNEEKARLFSEESNGALKKITCRRVIGVEDDDEFAGRMGEPIVQIPGFRVLVASARQILHAQLLAQFLQIGVPMLRFGCLYQTIGISLLLGSAVVKQNYRQFVRRILYRFGGGERSRQKIPIFVVSRNENVDVGNSSSLRRGANREGSGIATTNKDRPNMPTLYISAR
jgi:hypothetical protein